MLFHLQGVQWRLFVLPPPFPPSHASYFRPQPQAVRICVCYLSRRRWPGDKSLQPAFFPDRNLKSVLRRNKLAPADDDVAGAAWFIACEARSSCKKDRLRAREKKREIRANWKFSHAGTRPSSRSHQIELNIYTPVHSCIFQPIVNIGKI